MKKFLRKWLEIEDRSPMEKLFPPDEKQDFLDNVNDTLTKVQENQLALYQELRTDLNYLKGQVKNIKPILKVDSPETELFIKDVLKKQTDLVRTQQYAIEDKLLQTRNLEQMTEANVANMRNDANKINEKFELVMKTLKEIKADKTNEQQDNTTQQ